jgi:two-component system response regulator YesN
MYKVLIVDDEKYVRRWVRNCIDWTQYGFCIIGEAINGEDALQKIRDLHPDVVFLDMKMPIMDGATVIEKVNLMNPQIFFVVLSGYKEYEYMRSAIKNNAVDYLLKPIKPEDVLDALIKVQSRLEEVQKRSGMELQRKKMMKENLELRKERFLSDLLDEKVITSIELDKKLSEFGIEICENRFAVVIINYDTINTGPKRGSPKDDELLKSSIRNICSELYAQKNIKSCFFNKNDNIISILSTLLDGPEMAKLVMDTCRLALDRINRFLNISIYFAIGNVVDNVICLGYSYKEACKAMELRILYGKNNVVTVFDTPKGFLPDILDFTEENKLITAIKSADYALSKDVVGKIFQKLQGIRMPGIETIKMVYYRLISVILRSIYDIGITPSYLSIDEIKLFSAISEMDSLEEMQEEIILLIQNAISGIRNKLSIKNSVVEKAKFYINENLSKEINLTNIADYVHITPNYLCSLFKAETRQNLSDYIINLRIEKAKSLLQDEELRIYEIGEKVGYKETKYFCRVFKKITGKSPMQFRKSAKAKSI